MARTVNTLNMFEPEVFQEIVNALEPERGLFLYNQVRKDTTTVPYVTWTVKQGQFSDLAEYNTPNSKANLVEKSPIRQAPGQATLAYLREGDYFTPTATMFVKDYESGNDAALVPAERHVTEQIQYVNNRINNRIEWSLWQAIQGSINYTGRQTGPLVVDYAFKPTHQTTLASDTQWDQNPAIGSLISMIRDTKSMVRRDGGVDVTDVFLTRQTMDLLIKAWTDAATSDANRALLTDSMINQYFATGEVSGFMGTSNWKTVDQYYDVRNEDGSVSVKPYLEHGTVLFANLSANNPLRYTTGPAADFTAPAGHIGRFAKNWTNEDPSGRQFLIEEMGLPVLDRPDQFATVKVASQGWVTSQTWNY